MAEPQDPDPGKPRAQATPSPIMVEIVEKKRRLTQRISEQIPLFISLIALGTSIWSGIESRQHDRLSVLPMVSFIRQGDLTGNEIGLYIENDGLGPAKLSRMYIALDGKELPNLDAIGNATSEMYRQAMPGWGYPLLLQTNTRVPVFYSHTDNVQDSEGFRNLINQRLFIMVKACSFYGDCRIVCSNLPNDADCLHAAESLPQAMNDLN